MKYIVIVIITLCMLDLFSACKTQKSSVEEQIPVVSVRTTSVKQGDIENRLSLNGKTVYLRKNIIISPIAGYITRINIKYGDVVQKNDVLFEIQTKENKALENSGIVKVFAPSGGTINELNINEPGDIWLKVDQCSIVENSDFLIQMNVPFKYNELIKRNLKCKIILPDNTKLNGYVYKLLPTIDDGADSTGTG